MPCSQYGHHPFTGEITKDEFKRALPQLSLWPDPREVDELFDSYDKDLSGAITFVELNRMLRRTRSTGDALNSRHDPVQPAVVDLVDLPALRAEVRHKACSIREFDGEEIAVCTCLRALDVFRSPSKSDCTPCKMILMTSSLRMPMPLRTVLGCHSTRSLPS